MSKNMAIKPCSHSVARIFKPFSPEQENSMNPTILSVQNLKKTYRTKTQTSLVLKNVNMDVQAGEFVAVMGPSGSGKTTLLNILSGFLTAESGKVLLSGKDILTADENTLANLRQNELGFVFQDFMLLDSLTAEENIFLPQIIAGKRPDAINTDTAQLLEQFDISEAAKKYPAEISGGQKQRVAVARALSNSPQLILADEPTGNLDSKSGAAVMEAFLTAKQLLGATILMVTHDAQAASHSDRVIALADGIVTRELHHQDSGASFLDRILSYLGEATK